MKISTISAALAGVILGAVVLNYYQQQQSGVDTVQALATPSSSVSYPSLEVGESAEGELTSASFLNLVDGVRSQAYTLKSNTNEIIRLRVDGALDAQISVLRQDQLISRQNCAECERSAEHPVEPVMLAFKAQENQEYTLVVSGRDTRAYGPFKLSTMMLKSYAGDVLTGTEELVDWGMGEPRRYRLNIEKEGVYRFDMRAQQNSLDSYLALKDRRGREIANDDDGGLDLDAQMQAYLAPGEYILEANSALGRQSFQGGYSLQIQALPMPEKFDLQEHTDLVLDGQSRDGLYRGKMQTYTFVLPDRAVVDIELDALGFNPELRLNDISSYSQEAEGKFKLRQLLPAGNHKLVVDGRGQGGVFSLKIDQSTPPANSGGGPLLLGEKHHAYLLGGTQRDIYTFTVSHAGQYRIAMESAHIDAYLELRHQDQLLAEDDDSGGDMNALLERHLEPGEYQLHALSLGQSDEDVPYQISVTQR